MSDWSNPVPNEVAYRRAGGRRRYNALRRFRAALRQRYVAQLLLDHIPQAEIARRLGVHRATITRDIATLREEVFKSGVCPCCGAYRGRGEINLARMMHYMNNERLGVGQPPRQAPGVEL